MKVGDTNTITIAGAGLSGSLLAVLLAQRGFKVELFERNPDQRAALAPAGRSINLALAERGRHALEMAGLMEKVDRFTIPMRGRLLHQEDGEVILQPYGASQGEVIWSTHRALLNSELLNAAQATGRVDIRFDHAVRDIDWPNNVVRLDNGEHHEFEVLIGTDGGGSAVRRAMQEVKDLGVSEDILTHGYRELTIAPDENDEYALDPNALHIWPRGGFMLIALPNADRSFTATLFLPNKADTSRGEDSFEQLTSWSEQSAFCKKYFPDAVALMPQLQLDFEENPVGMLGTIRCHQWYLDDRAVLMGDAAHAVVPFHGQGMNAAFEDVVDFIELTGNSDQRWAEVFERYQQARIDNSNAIADMALENYQIMRESVRDPAFLLRKALEHELERRFGERFIARYSQVMFHRIPYAQAYKRGAIQADLLDQLLEGTSSLKDIDWSFAGREIRNQLDLIRESG